MGARQCLSPFFPEVHMSSRYYDMPHTRLASVLLLQLLSHLLTVLKNKGIRAPTSSGWVCGHTSLPAHSYRMEDEGEPSVQAVQGHICTRWTRLLGYPLRALRVYIEKFYWKSEQLFVGFGNRTKGGPVTKQTIYRWLVNAITLAYSSSGVAVPRRSQNPFHQRHRLFLGMVQRGVHFRHLWGGWLVLAIHILKVLQPGCPRLAGQIFFCLSNNLSGSLDEHCSSPSFAWSVHNYMGARCHFGTTPRPRMTLKAHPVLGVFYWLPWA